MCNAAFEGARERILMKNIAYVGALAALLDIDMDDRRARCSTEKFSQEDGAARRRTTRRSTLGYDYAKEHFDCPLPFRLEKMDATQDTILIDGNTAAALGCVYAGATVGAWYPITPSTSLMDAFKELLREVPERPGDRQEQATASCRPRTSWRRSAW